MELPFNICRAQPVGGNKFGHARRTNIHSLVSLCEVGLKTTDIYEIPDPFKEKCCSRWFSLPVSLNECHQISSALVPDFHVQQAIFDKPFDELHSLSDRLIIVSKHANNKTQNIGLSSSVSNVCTAPERQLLASSDNPPQHIDCCKSQSPVLKNTKEGTVDVPEQRRQISPSSITSYSPSPVCSRVLSPVVCGTMTVSVYTESSQTFTIPISDTKPDKVIGEHHTDFLAGEGVKELLTGFTQKRSPAGDAHTFVNANSQVYPNYMNPFDSDDIAEDSVEHVIEAASVKNSNFCTGKNPFDVDFSPSSKTVGNPFDIPDNFTAKQVSTRQPCNPIRVSRPKKKPAPPPPLYPPSPTNSTADVSLANMNHTPLPDSISYCSTIDTIPMRERTNYRSNSTHLSAAVFGSNRDSHATETKSMIIKGPAPSLPVYTKRIVKADSSDAFMSYDKLHELLYLTNKRIINLESQARKLQHEIKFANKKRSNVGGMLDKWAKVVELRDALSKRHTQLLERLRQQELEERHANLEHEFRLLWAKQNNLKTPEEKEREARLLDELLETVNRRAELVELCDEQTDCSTEHTSTSKTRKSHKLCLGMLKGIRKLRTRSLSVLSFKI